MDGRTNSFYVRRFVCSIDDDYDDFIAAIYLRDSDPYNSDYILTLRWLNGQIRTH